MRAGVNTTRKCCTCEEQKKLLRCDCLREDLLCLNCSLFLDSVASASGTETKVLKGGKVSPGPLMWGPFQGDTCEKGGSVLTRLSEVKNLWGRNVSHPGEIKRFPEFQKDRVYREGM